jgi:hypothetical protein
MKMRALKLLERADSRISEFGSIVVTALAIVAAAGAAMQLTLGETVEAVFTNL